MYCSFNENGKLDYTVRKLNTILGTNRDSPIIRFLRKFPFYYAHLSDYGC